MFRSIKAKMLAVFITALVFGSAFSIYLFVFTKAQKEDLDQIRSLERVSLALSDISILGREFAMTGEETVRGRWLEKVRFIEGILSEPDFRENLGKKNFRELNAIIDEVESLVREVFSEDFEKSDNWLVFSVLPRIQEAEAKMGDIYRRDFSEMGAREDRLLNSLLIIAGVQLLILFFLCLHTYRSVVRPLSLLREGLKKVGAGELGTELRITDQEEFQEIFETFNSELSNLREVTASRDALHREIAERQTVQEKLEEAIDKVQRVNGELQQFAYVASHDLQEPLRMVASYTQLLEKRYGDSLNDDARRWIGFAVDGARRMKRLIEELLRYSRLETDRRDLKEVSLDEVYRAALTHLSVLIEETGASVQSDKLPLIKGDRDRLVSLFQNLIGNAIKYRREGVRPEIRISVEPGEGEWIFRIADNGIGIDQQFREKIFVIFQRLHARDKFEGTGIGLALCRRIVEQHGGTLELEDCSEINPVDHGSVFRFTLEMSANHPSSKASV